MSDSFRAGSSNSVAEPPPTPGPWLPLLGTAVGARTLGALLAAPSLHPDPRLETAALHLASGHGLALGPATAPVPTGALPPVTPALLAMAGRVVHGHPLVLP